MLPTASTRLALATLLIVAAGSGASLGLQAAPAPKAAKATPAKRSITHDLYDTWRSIQGTRLSRDGQWVAYAMAAQEGDGELVVKHLRTGQTFRHPRGKDPVFAAEGRFVAFAVAPPKAEVDQAKKAKKKPDAMPKAGLGVMDLTTGKVETLDRVKSFRLADEGGRFLAALLEAAPKADSTQEAKAEGDAKDAEDQRARPGGAGEAKKNEPGTDLVLWELGTAQRTTVPEVGEYRWNKPGTLLAYTVVPKPSPKKEGKAAKEGAEAKPDAEAPMRQGVFLRRMDGTPERALLAGPGKVRSLAFDEAGRQLAFLSDHAEAKAEAPAFRLYLWQDGQETTREVAAKGAAGLPEGWAPSEHGALDFSKDGARLFFGSAEAPKAEPKDAPEPMKVDLWHWKDPELQPMQKVRAENERKRSFRAVLQVAEGRIVQLGNATLPEVLVNENPRVALGFDPAAYRMAASWDTLYADAYAVDLATGARKLLARKVRFSESLREGSGLLSPEGGFFLQWDGEAKAWMSVDTATGQARNLTGSLGVGFHDEELDMPMAATPHGQGGWVEGDRAVLLYDRNDVWAVKPDGTGARRLTQGREGKVELRALRLDPEARAHPVGKPLVLSATQEQTRASGFYTADLEGTAAPVRRFWADKLVGGLLKAKNSEAVVFTQQRFDEYPDLWASDLAFKAPARISEGHQQMEGLLWGRSEVIEYVNGDGQRLRALLTKPANFDPSKKYPLLVYIYERLSDELHRFQHPGPGTGVNFSRFASNGYVILRPDIVYETGYPGKSAMKCVLPAVEQTVAKGFIDPARIGIAGHSWGGYQITYMVTQTNLFKAAEAGAPVSNMTSAYGGIRWGTGMSRAFQYEHTQSRIGGTPWDKPLQFIENSPLFWVERVQTPLLMLHNDEDDAVPWYQGIEFISALRRLGREGWMFNFNGEKHGLRERPAQKYWTIHLCEFFDHLLLGAPRPAWMDAPVPYLERGKRNVDELYKAK